MTLCVSSCLRFHLSPESSLNLGTCTWWANCNVVYLIRNPPTVGTHWELLSSTFTAFKTLDLIYQRKTRRNYWTDGILWSAMWFWPPAWYSVGPPPCPIKTRALLQPWWCGTPVWFYGGSTGLRSGSHGGPVNTSNALLSSSNIREPFSCPWQGAWSCWKRPPPSGSIISMTGWTWDEIDPTRQSSFLLLHVVQDTEVSDSLCIPIMAIPNS